MAAGGRASQACTAGPEEKEEEREGGSEKETRARESPDQEALANMTTLQNLLGALFSLRADSKRAPGHRCPFVTANRLEKGTGHVRALICHLALANMMTLHI